LKLYKAQQGGVDFFLASPAPHRALIAADTGCGKTPISIEALKALRPGKTLVVCPAVGRRHWEKEYSRWWPEHPPVGVIEFGRKRESLTEKSKAERAAAYANPVQVVSFDLVKEVEPTGWDAIVIDEAHHLQHPTSQQSKLIRTLVRANAQAHVVALSATAIPTEVRGIWHPLHILWPQDWGRLESNGRESYRFLNAYCNRELTNSGHTRYFGFREEKRAELEERLRKYVYRLTREDIKDDLPPLDVTGFYQDNVRDLCEVGADWAAELGEAVTHFGVFTYHRDLAERVRERLAADFPDYRVECIDGSMDATTRSRTLDALQESSRAILVGTTEALRESIRLMWVQHALVLEWRKSPSQVTQFLGRFNSVGHAGAPPAVKVLITPDTAQAASELMRRMEDINSLLRASKSDENVAKVFAERERTEDELDAMWDKVLSGVNLQKLEWEGDSDG
jgi:hypothetical protein